MLLHHKDGCCAVSILFVDVSIYITPLKQIFLPGIPWSLVLDINGTFLHHTRGWTFLLDNVMTSLAPNMDVCTTRKWMFFCHKMDVRVRQIYRTWLFLHHNVKRGSSYYTMVVVMRSQWFAFFIFLYSYQVLPGPLFYLLYSSKFTYLCFDVIAKILSDFASFAKMFWIFSNLKLFPNLIESFKILFIRVIRWFFLWWIWVKWWIKWGFKWWFKILYLDDIPITNIMLTYLVNILTYLTNLFTNLTESIQILNDFGRRFTKFHFTFSM